MKFLNLFRKRNNDGGVCACNGQRIKLKKDHYQYERAPLEDNQHTSFGVMFCKKCDGLVCMPPPIFKKVM